MASTDLDLCYLTATEAIDQFKAKKLSPVELMKALLARCEAVNPKLNVLTYTFAERALEQSKAAETRYMRGDARPLEGIPVAIKDFHPVKDEITTFGSQVYRNFRSATPLRLSNVCSMLARLCTVARPPRNSLTPG
jgi:Asp-tRNA(Asn)/Glu-tRNA(Gln) amidotransferase A subunit family amidase